MSSISDAAYLGNSYQQIYNSAGQFDIVSTSNLQVSGDISVGGKINGLLQTRILTGYISKTDVETVGADSSGDINRAFHLTSNYTDTDTNYLTLPVGSIIRTATFCKISGTENQFASGATPNLQIVSIDSSTYDPDNLATVVAEIFTSQTAATLNSTSTIANSVLVPVGETTDNVDVGGSGSIGFTTEQTVTLSNGSGSSFTSGDGLKLQIVYFELPTSEEFLSDNY